jgi:hypothetical protein
MGHLSGKVLFAIALGAGVCIGWFIRFPPTDSASAAGWAQAVGSMASVGIAVFVATEIEARRQNAVRARPLNSVLAHCDGMKNLLQQVLDRRASTDHFVAATRNRTHFDRAEAVGSALNGLPLHEMPTYDSVQLLDSLKEQVEQSRAILKPRGMLDAALDNEKAAAQLVRYTEIAAAIRSEIDSIKRGDR